MTALVLDSEAFLALARSRTGQRPGLAEQYRGGQHGQVVDSCLGRLTGIEVAETTRQLSTTVETS